MLRRRWKVMSQPADISLVKLSSCEMGGVQGGTCCCARPSKRRLQVNSSTMIMAKLYTSAARVILPFCKSSGAMYAAVPAKHTPNKDLETMPVQPKDLLNAHCKHLFWQNWRCQRCSCDNNSRSFLTIGECRDMCSVCLQHSREPKVCHLE